MNGNDNFCLCDSGVEGIYWAVRPKFGTNHGNPCVSNSMCIVSLPVQSTLGSSKFKGPEKTSKYREFEILISVNNLWVETFLVRFTELDVSIQFELGYSVSGPLKFLSFDLLSVPKCVVFFDLHFTVSFSMDSTVIERF